MNAIAELLAQVRNGHDSVQVEHFITTRGGSLHLWGMYRQALREFDGRVSALVHLWRQACESARTIVTREAWLACELVDASKVREPALAIFSGACDRIEHAQLTRRCRDTLREFSQFFHHALGLAEYFGSLTEDERRERELNFWEFRLMLVGAIDKLTTGRLQGSLLELIPSLPQPLRGRLNALRTATNDQGGDAWLDWYDALCERGAPEIPAPARVYDLSELVAMVLECESYVTATQPLDREPRAELAADASLDLLADRSDAVHLRDDLPHRSPALARPR